MAGDKVNLDGAFLWDRVHIADNVEICHSVVCDEAEVKERVKLKPHCVLSSQVSCIYLSSAFCLSWQFTRLTLDHARAAPNLSAEVGNMLLLPHSSFFCLAKIVQDVI